MKRDKKKKISLVANMEGTKGTIPHMNWYTFKSTSSKYSKLNLACATDNALLGLDL